MKKIIQHLLLLGLLPFGLQAQTIDVTAPCLGATFTFTLDPTESPDASGRNVYFHAPASIEIQFNTQLDRWEIRARGGNFDVYYHNDFASAPNPPDNVTSPWEDNAICDGTGLPTVSGDGTQNTLGEDPCAELGGDTDGDGVCDDNDRCPGEDDDLDQDNDNIPDACDDNPTVADGVLVQAPCLDEDQPLILLPARVDATGRNVYINETYQIEVRYNAELGRWEVTAEEPGTDVYFYNELASFPDPPTSSLYPWTETGSLCTGSTVSVSGTGTQSGLGCAMTIAFSDIIPTRPTCPDGADGALSVTAMNAKGPIGYSLNAVTNADGSFTGLTAGEYALVVRDSAFPEMGASACQIETPILIEAGVDLVPPTAVCRASAAVELDDTGMGMLTVDSVDMASMDACGVVSLALDREAFSCDDLGELIVTLTVTDEVGLTASCTTTVTVEDTAGFCAATPTRDLSVNGRSLARLPLAPNPTAEGVTVDLSAFEWNAQQRVILSVFDGRGQQLQQQEVSRSSDGSYYLPTRELPAGVYFLRLNIDGRPLAVARLVVASN